MNFVMICAVIGALVAAAAVAVWLKPAHKQFWLCVGVSTMGLGWPIASVVLWWSGASWLWAQLLTAWPAIGVGLALQDAATPPSGGTAAGQLQRKAAIERLIMFAILVVVEMVVAGHVRNKWNEQAKEAAAAQPAPIAKALTVEAAQFVRGVVRDPGYLEERIKEHKLLISSIAPGAVWEPQRILRDGKLVLTVADLDDLRAGYTIELTDSSPAVVPTAEAGAVPQYTGGWLKIWGIGAQLEPAAAEVLRGVYSRQQEADALEWLGHWVDPISGEVLPLRFYASTNGRFVRVVGAKVLYGPRGERVFDLALYRRHEEFRQKVARGAVGLGGKFNPPYTGGKEPVRGKSLF
jgi:hypothetical protein